MDDLGFGGPYQAPPVRASASAGDVPPAPAGTSRSLPKSRVLLGAALAAVIALGAFYFLVLADEGGQAIAAQNQQALDTAGQADDRAAESTLRNALAAAATAALDAGSPAGLTPQVLQGVEPSLTWTTSPSTGSEVVSVSSSDAAFGAAALSDSGTCLWVKQTASGATTYGSGQPCTGKAALAASDPAW